ncbi:MAG: hypothetical protein U1A78_37645 [Polyangia bacterium]
MGKLWAGMGGDGDQPGTLLRITGACADASATDSMDRAARARARGRHRARRAGEGFRLAGTPGRWRDFYGERSPADFDLDADKGVLCWNARLARADVLSGKKLHTLLGDDWRKIIYR